MENNNFDMSLFDSDSIELNLGASPFDLEDTTSEANAVEDTTETTDDTENNNPDESADSDTVAGDNLDNEGDDDDINDDDDSSPNIYSPFASVLNEQGLLPSLDSTQINNIKSADDLAAVIKTEIDNQSKEFIINKIGEDGYDALEKGVSLAEYQQYEQNNLVLDSIDSNKLSEDMELSKNIILQDYIAQGLSEDRAMRILKKTIDLGEDAILEDAQQSLESLKVHQSVQLEKIKAENALKMEQAQAAQEKIDNDLKNSIYNSNEIIKGIKLNKTVKDNLHASITKIVGKSPNGVLENKLMQDRRENPIEFDIKMHYLYNLTNGFSDFSKLTRKSTSKAVSSFEDALRRTNPNDKGGTPNFMTDPESYGGVGDEIVY